MFFRTRQCTRVHRLILGVQKMCKIGGKGVCFWSYWRIWKGHEDAYKNAYQGSILIPEIYVFRVCFKSPKPFNEDDIQWRHQNFFVGASRGQNAFLRGQISKTNCRKRLILAFFSSGGGGGGGQVRGSRTSGCGGKCPYAPLMPPLMISSLRYKCPPESKLIYDYREKTWKIV